VIRVIVRLRRQVCRLQQICLNLVFGAKVVVEFPSINNWLKEAKSGQNPVTWTEEAEKSFVNIKRSLTKTRTLSHPVPGAL
jgi:hypothetical protein